MLLKCDLGWAEDAVLIIIVPHKPFESLVFVAIFRADVIEEITPAVSTEDVTPVEVEQVWRLCFF